MGMVQRIGDLQWRMLRLTKNKRVFNENCLAQAAQLAHPGATQDQLCNLDSLNALRIATELKMPKEFRREESALVRLLAASYRDLNMLRKLDPAPKTPLTRNAEILGPSRANSQFDNPPPPEITKVGPVETMRKLPRRLTTKAKSSPACRPRKTSFRPLFGPK